MNLPKIVTRDEWLEARKELLAREKDFDRERDRPSETRVFLDRWRVSNSISPWLASLPHPAARAIGSRPATAQKKVNCSFRR
jgi:hypothetical protein